jgi:hypothetical protein
MRKIVPTSYRQSLPASSWNLHLFNLHKGNPAVAFRETVDYLNLLVDCFVDRLSKGRLTSSTSSK